MGLQVVVKANEVVLFEIKIDLLQREKHAKLNSKIWAKSDIQSERNRWLKIFLYLIVFANIVVKYAH